MRIIVTLLVLFATYGPITAARAQSDDCKDCRLQLQACLKNHSQTACNTEYRICMNHCRRK